MPTQVLAKFHTPSGSKCYISKYWLEDFWLKSDFSRISRTLSSIAGSNKKKVTTIYPSRTAGMMRADGSSIDDSRYLSYLLIRNGVNSLAISNAAEPRHIQKCLKQLVKKDIREKDYYLDFSEKRFLGIPKTNFLGRILISDHLVDFKSGNFQQPLLSIKFDSKTALMDGDLYRSILYSYKNKRRELEYVKSLFEKEVRLWTRFVLSYVVPTALTSGLFIPEVSDYIMDLLNPYTILGLTTLVISISKATDYFAREYPKTMIKSFLEIIEKSFQPTFIEKFGSTGLDKKHKVKGIINGETNLSFLKRAIDSVGRDNKKKLHAVLPDLVQLRLLSMGNEKNLKRIWELVKKLYPDDSLEMYETWTRLDH